VTRVAFTVRGARRPTPQMEAPRRTSARGQDTP
jgi:hypothetical protein